MILPVDVSKRRSFRDDELALALVRSSPVMHRFLPILRKCSALIHRDDGSGIIVQRIIGNEPILNSQLEWIFCRMTFQCEGKAHPKLPEMIEMYGWPIVREIAVVVLLHQIHADVAAPFKVSPVALDLRALAVLTAGCELGASNFAALFANVGELAIALHDQTHAKALPSGYVLGNAESVSMERSLYGFDHGVLGSHMLAEVDFPPSMCDEVMEHTVIGSHIWVAEQLALDVRTHPDPRPGAENRIWQTLGLSPRRTAALRENIARSGDLALLAFCEGPAKVA